MVTEGVTTGRTISSGRGDIGGIGIADVARSELSRIHRRVHGPFVRLAADVAE
jgi:hypothetical protein